MPFSEEAQQVWVYVLLEHQSTPDRLMGLRLLSYMVQIWETQRRGWEHDHMVSDECWLSPIIPILFYTGSESWTRPVTLEALMQAPTALAPFIPRHDLLTLKLNETAAEALQGSMLAYVLQVMQAEDAPLAEMEQVLTRAVTHLEQLSVADQARWRELMQYILLLIYHRRDIGEHDTLSLVVTEASLTHRGEVREMTTSYAEVLLRQGREAGLQEGLQEGLQKGLQEGYSELLLEQLEPNLVPYQPKRWRRSKHCRWHAQRNWHIKF